MFLMLPLASPPGPLKALSEEVERARPFDLPAALETLERLGLTGIIRQVEERQPPPKTMTEFLDCFKFSHSKEDFLLAYMS